MCSDISEDASGEGMWIFHPRVAKLRHKYDLMVKIESHPERDVSGRREGRVLADVEALAHPIPSTTLASVLVHFTDGKSEERKEFLPVSTLRPTAKLKDKGLHVVTKGEWIGTLVQHMRTERGRARVFPENGHRLEAFSIEKKKLCIVETPM